MQEYTLNEIRSKTPEIFNQVQEDGMVKISARHRPEMVLIRQDLLDPVKDKIQGFTQTAAGKRAGKKPSK